MDARSRLARNLVAESKAYGYTLTIWGAGALLIATYGTPTPLQIFAYVTGAVVGFGVLAGAAFNQLFGDVESSADQQLAVVGMIHVVATLGNLVLSFLFIRYLGANLVTVAVFALIGFQATVAYNLLLLLESAVSRVVLKHAPDGIDPEQSG